MKKKIALLLMVFMLVVSLIPAVALAEDDKGLSAAITAVKEKIDIPGNYTMITYNLYSDGDEKVWYLNWGRKDDEPGSISVRVDTDGTILNYSHYSGNDYSGKKLPSISRENALSKANAFIEKMDAGLPEKLKYSDNNDVTLNQRYYNFTFYRVEKGIPLYNNIVSVDVNSDTGEVSSYYREWTKGVDFPAATNIMTMSRAQEIYKDKLGLRLTYNYTYDKIYKIFNAFTEKFSNNRTIDAFTGEIFANEYGYYGRSVNASNSMDKENSGSQGGVVFTPEEMGEIEKVSKLISKDEAEAKARSISALGIVKDYELQSYRLSTEWPAKETYIWNLDFTIKSTDKTYNYIHVSLDAASGEIRSYNWNINIEPEDKEVIKVEADAKAAAEKFISEAAPGKMDQVVFEEAYESDYNYKYDMDKEKQRFFSFRYIRKANDILFPGNSLTITYDALNDKVFSFNSTWFAVDLIKPDKPAMQIDSIYEKLFNEIGLELQYVLDYSQNSDPKAIYGYSGNKPAVRLVYALKADKPAIFDAFDGTILQYDGKPFKENKPISYTDISGCSGEEQIKLLADNGVGFQDSEYRPNDMITQKDFLYLLSKCLWTYNIYTPTDDSDTEDMYKQLLKEGILKDGEKSPEAIVTREDAAKYMVRALKLDKIADINRIFNNSYKDAASIDPSLTGYVAIADGLGIVPSINGNVSPKVKVTRGAAAVIIYNYLLQ